MRADSDFTVLVVVFVAIGYVIAGPYCLVWVSVPVALVAVPLAVLAGVAAAVVRALRVLAGAGDGLTARPG
ncbi:MAG TPA: hypothetical protein VFC00_22020, partial [Micromonosporaceae bacterium]|nr:hypothetical protein [Micromonosporaceae bacterium]